MAVIAMISADTLRADAGRERDPTGARRFNPQGRMRACEALRAGPHRSRSCNEAVILLSAWVYQATAQARNVFSADQEGPPINVSRAFLLSGAQGLLSPWRVNRARGRVGDALALAVAGRTGRASARAIPTKS